MNYLKKKVNYYNNICNQEYQNEKDLPSLIKFLKNESEKQQSKNKKDSLIAVISCLLFIKDFVNEKENTDIYEFKLDDFYNLLNDKKKLMNSSNILKKEKQLIEEGKNISLYSPSFIYFINNNQNFVNELFTNINNSDKSIIYDLYKKRKINYLPFWLYILRNISSLNCLEYGKKDIDKNIANDIVNKIKKKISDCLNNKKPLTSQWLNLLLDNVSSEIIDPNIHLFYYYFNSLINNLNISGKIIKKIAIEELAQYFYEIIDCVFEQKLNTLLNDEINNNKDNLIIKFTKNPLSYLYEKIKLKVNDKFLEIMEKENIYNLTKDFNDTIKSLSDNFRKKIKETNETLFNKEYQNLLDEYSKEIDKKFNALCKCNSSNITYIDKIIKKKEFGELTNKQINDNNIIELNDLKKDLEKYIKFGLKKSNENLTCFKIEYDFTKIKDKDYNLLYKEKIVAINHDVFNGFIYIIEDENNDEFKKNLN